MAHAHEAQHVWVYCEDEDVERDVLAVCQDCRRQQISPTVVRPPPLSPTAGVSWHSRLQGLLTSLPPPYGAAADRAGFWLDVEALVLASRECRERRQARRQQVLSTLGSTEVHPADRQAGRLPSLLITDRSRLCAALCASSELRHNIAQAADLEPDDLLPVVLAEDFGLVSGQVASAEPLPVAESAALRLAAAAPASRPVSPAAGGAPAAEPQTVHFDRLGVFVQRPAPAAGGSVPLYGSRYVALLPDGRAAYSAVSSDGLRRVNAAGTWQEVQGYMVISGDVRYTDLGDKAEATISTTVYKEPVHISVLELSTDFEPPIDLSEALPSPGDRVRLATRRPPELPEAPMPAVSLTVPPRLGSGRPSEDVGEGTATHALRRLAASPASASPGGGARSPGGRQQLFYSRLTGRGEGLRPAAPASVASLLEAMPPEMLRSWPAPAGGYKFTAPSVQPGTYSLEAGAGASRRSLKLVLSPDGRCSYREAVPGCTVQSSAPARWRVEGAALLLEPASASRRGAPFTMREARGKRNVERRVLSVSVPVREVLQFCQFAPFQQYVAPFPGHAPAGEAELVMGAVDARSPVIRNMPMPHDCLPYSAFVDDIKAHGLGMDEIISDFRFIDADGSGSLTAEEMQRLEGYGDVVAPPEVMHAFRLALLGRHETLEAAFEAMAGASGRLTLDGFQAYLAAAQEAGTSAATVQDWLRQVPEEEDRARVFASVNPDKAESIGLPDFLSLHLHTAVLAVRRLAHLQTWIFQEFGNSAEAFAEVFKSLSKGRTQIDRQRFTAGLQALGYPCGDEALRSIFAFCDFNSNSKMTVQEFQSLRDFSAGGFLEGLRQLRAYTEERFGGLEKAFRRMLRAEKVIKNSSWSPQTASFAAFEQVFREPDFREKVQDIDLRMVFTFVDEATARHADGTIAASEWLLLQGLDASCLSGSPARLRRLLEQRHGSVAEAFERLHGDWLASTLQRGLQQAALEGIIRGLCREPAAAGSPLAASGLAEGGRSLGRVVSAAALDGLRPRFPELSGGRGRGKGAADGIAAKSTRSEGLGRVTSLPAL